VFGSGGDGSLREIAIWYDLGRNLIRNEFSYLLHLRASRRRRTQQRWTCGNSAIWAPMTAAPP
jgi:hypothetical protein